MNFDCDTWLKEPMSRPYRYGPANWQVPFSYDKTCLRGHRWRRCEIVGTTDNRLQLHLGGNLRRTWYRRTRGRRETWTARATGRGWGDKGCNCLASVWVTDGRWNSRQRCICRLVGDEQVVRRPCWVATTARSDGRVLSLVGWQSDDTVGITVRQ